MRAVILAGGEGTRLRPLTFAIPKPLIPVGEKPILEIIIRRLKKLGFKKYIFSVGYKAELVRTYFRHGEKFGIQIDYIHEDQPLGTAGSLRIIADKFHFASDESFMLMNGDILTRLDFQRMAEFHRKSKSWLTVGVKEYSHRLPFGVLEVKRGRIHSITEKPTETYPISTGIYMINTACLQYMPLGRPYTMPMLINAVLGEGRKVMPYFFKEDWMAVEHLQHLEEINGDLERWVKE